MFDRPPSERSCIKPAFTINETRSYHSDGIIEIPTAEFFRHNTEY